MLESLPGTCKSSISKSKGNRRNQKSSSFFVRVEYSTVRILVRGCSRNRRKSLPVSSLELVGSFANGVGGEPRSERTVWHWEVPLFARLRSTVSNMPLQERRANFPGQPIISCGGARERSRFQRPPDCVARLRRGQPLLLPASLGPRAKIKKSSCQLLGCVTFHASVALRSVPPGP